MALPQSFTRDGFLNLTLPVHQPKFRRLMIGSDGPAGSGKTEFALSAPAPGIGIFLDRGSDAVFDNPNPPPARQSDFGYKVIYVPKVQQTDQNGFMTYWQNFYKEYIKALENQDCRTVLIDGDSDSWELQRLAAFGKLTQIPSILYTNVNAARRAMIARAYDSGKIIIATNKISREYRTLHNPDGSPLLKDGREVREWDGKSYQRQGFSDQDYLWHIQIRHLYRAATNEWGVKIMKCKIDPTLEEYELWGKDCNFPGLVQTVYPHISPREWGF